MLPADRGFDGVDLWCRAAATGADLLWRVRKDLALPVVEQLPDGFCLPEIFDRGDIHHTRRGVPVRAVEYTVAGHEGVYRLITTILDPNKAPAGYVGLIRITLTAHRTVVLVDRVDHDRVTAEVARTHALTNRPLNSRFISHDSHSARRPHA